ncbi:hypothetical protein Syun_014315 [Stephania yunnanensis]|uniref:Uncharacterized protein n=1 Tax=Stephania yunnanensis TaxID=152371 RepID=A0AAP0JL84_9MAGN
MFRSLKIKDRNISFLTQSTTNNNDNLIFESHIHTPTVPKLKIKLETLTFQRPTVEPIQNCEDEERKEERTERTERSETEMLAETKEERSETETIAKPERMN